MGYIIVLNRNWPTQSQSIDIITTLCNWPGHFKPRLTAAVARSYSNKANDEDETMTEIIIVPTGRMGVLITKLFATEPGLLLIGDRQQTKHLNIHMQLITSFVFNYLWFYCKQSICKCFSPLIRLIPKLKKHDNGLITRPKQQNKNK